MEQRSDSFGGFDISKHLANSGSLSIIFVFTGLMKVISVGPYNIYLGNPFDELDNFLSASKYSDSSVFVLVDENTKKYCLPELKKNISHFQRIKIISIKSGEKNKNIRTCQHIWNELLKQNADRKSLLLNLGGGVISDIGGFCASTFKRGIDFINIPTTLLAQADASIGGKTGFDFAGLKNQIGTFAFPKAIFVFTSFLRTLSKRQLLSGFAEMIKMALIADKNYWKKLSQVNINSLSSEIIRTDFRNLSEVEPLLEHCIKLKNEIVSKDPFEKGSRKILNFGHTIGHAFESISLKTKNPLLHGEAVAMGMICEAYLSHKYCGLSGKELDEIVSCLYSIFNKKHINTSTKNLISKMKRDKKNTNEKINFTLLSTIGKAKLNNFCTEEIIKESILFYNGL
jgi:3-dehydroquinate synthase